jgi:ArsR family transcriptional regulator
MITAIAKPPARPRFQRKETPPVPALPEDTTNELVKLFKLLSDGTRLQIIHYLTAVPELNVGNLCELLEQSQPAVSHHLALLREAAIVEMRRDGKHNFYSLRRVSLARYQLLVNSLWDGITAGPAAQVAPSTTGSPPHPPANDASGASPSDTPPSPASPAAELPAVPGEIGPSTTGPSTTGPSATGPSATGPSATGPSATGTDAETRGALDDPSHPSNASDDLGHGKSNGDLNSDSNGESGASSDEPTEPPGGESGDAMA